MRSVYFIIPTIAIGGAEKRFIELWCYLQAHEKQFNFGLIFSRELDETIKTHPTVFKLLKPYTDKVIVYDIDVNLPTLKFQKTLYDFVCGHTAKEDILHFILSFPTYIFPLKHRKTVYSLTESSLLNVNIKARLMYMINVLKVKYADILDPVVHKQISSTLFFKKNRIFLTPGSFVDTKTFTPVQIGNKENWFVFLGRFFGIKQVLKLLATLPEVAKRIEASKLQINNYKFIFLGYGYQEDELHAMTAEPEFIKIPIEIRMTNKPEEILNKSKVFFSLQLRNNYPSKSLLEGIAAGNIPLVTDVGTTRMIAAPEFSYYVPEDFSAADIADRLIAILKLDDYALQQKINAGREFVIKNFSIEASVNYYTGIYKKFK